ncbi:hypothetical protein FRC00_003749, partial [Tulasnella sp. 408]
MASVDDIVSRLQGLSLGAKVVKHDPVTSPAAWKDALAAASDAPASYELTKTLVYKPKTAKTATPVPVIAIVREETETSSGSLGKKLNLKELRLANEDLMKEFFGADKDSVSPVSLDATSFPKVLTVLDQSLTTSDSLFAIHAGSNSSTIFLKGSEIASYVLSLQTADNKVQTIDFAALKAEAAAAAPNFSKMFNIVVEDPNAAASGSIDKLFVWQNSWGLSTRTIGVMVMVHGDDKGLVLPPRVATVQVVVVPVGITAKTTDEQRANINNTCQELVDRLAKVGVKARADFREGYTPGWKFNDWELKGVPIRLEIGPNDLEKKQTLSVRRDSGVKNPIALDQLEKEVPALLDNIHNDMYTKAKDLYDSRLKVVSKWEEVVPTLDAKCVVVMPWCEVESCEDDIKERSAKSAEQTDERAPSAGAKSLCIPFDQERW